MRISVLKRTSSLTLIDRSFSMRISQKPPGMLKPNQLAISTRAGTTRVAKKLGLIFSIPPKLQMLCCMFRANALQNHIDLRLLVNRTQQYNISGKKQITLLRDAPAYQMALSAYSRRDALSERPQNRNVGRFVLENPMLTFKDRPGVGPGLHSTPHIDEPKQITSPSSLQRDPKMTTMDLDKLSNKIYSLLERRLATERERRGI